MSFDTNWDIDYYKTDYESDEHWELRRSFIEAHKDKFPENDLVCLAQVFTNIEFLGCRYPAATMERVAALSKDVAEKFRKSRATKLKRTFVGASDAAGAKAKGRNSQTNSKSIISKNTTIPSLQSTFRKAKTPEEEEEEEQDTSTTETSNKRKAVNDDDDDDDDDDDGIAFQRPSFSNAPSTTTITNRPQAIANPTTSSTQFRQNNKRIPDTGFIILETITGPKSELTILQTSAAKQGAVIKFETEANNNSPNAPLKAVVYINGTVYGVAPLTQSKQEAKVEAYANALAFARKIHYTIKQKEIVDTVAVECQDKLDASTSTESKAKNQICADNKGFQMMKMLGWTGGALGTSGDGIKEPVSIEMKVDRSGLGLSSESSKLNYDHFYQYLTKYKTDETATYDLVFSKEFDKDERKSLHEIANRLSLKSRSRNDPDGGRYLVIQKKVSLLELANDIFNGGLQSRYYELISPTHPQLRRPTIAAPKKQPTNTVAMNYRQNQTGQNNRPNQTGQNNRPNQTGQNNRQNQTGQNNRPNQTGQNNRQNQTGQNNRPNQTGQNNRQNQTGQNNRRKRQKF